MSFAGRKLLLIPALLAFLVAASSAPAQQAARDQPNGLKVQSVKPKVNNIDAKPRVGADIEKALEKLKDLQDLNGLSRELQEKLKEVRKQNIDALRQVQGGSRFSQFSSATGRLGLDVEKPSAVMVEQLDVLKKQGIVVTNVRKGTPAEKAGFKTHDIILEVDAKPAPSQPAELAKLLGDLKKDQAVDIVVLRKGQKETIKGVTVPEAAKIDANPRLPGLPRAPRVQPPLLLGGGAATTTISRNKDHFTARFQEGRLHISISGKVEDKKAKVESVQIYDGKQVDTYDSLEKVPAAQRENVNNLLEAAARGNFQIQGQKKE